MFTKITILGSGTPIIDIDREGPAVALQRGRNHTYLFDAGRGVVRRALQAGLPMRDLKILFLTHLHSDHTTGLPDFLYTIEGRGPLTVYGPPGTSDMISHLQKAYQADRENRVNGLERRNPSWYEITMHEVESGPVYEDEVVQISCFPAKHGEWPCLGYVIMAGDKKIVISGDTAPTPALVEAAQGCNLLIHEVYSARKVGPNHPYHSQVHTSAVQLGEIAAQINPRKLVLYHQLYFGSTDEEVLADIRVNFSGEVISARDLEVVRPPR